MSISLVISLVSPLCLPAFPFVAVDVLITLLLLTEGPRYFDVLITPWRTSMSFSSFLSHTALSLDLKAFSLCHLHPQPKHSETLSKPPEIDTSPRVNENLCCHLLCGHLLGTGPHCHHKYIIHISMVTISEAKANTNNYYTIITTLEIIYTHTYIYIYIYIYRERER